MSLFTRLQQSDPRCLSGIFWSCDLLCQITVAWILSGFFIVGMNWIYSLVALRSDATEGDRSGRWGYNAQTGGDITKCYKWKRKWHHSLCTYSERNLIIGLKDGNGSILHWTAPTVSLGFISLFSIWNKVGPERSTFLLDVSMWNQHPWIISQPSRKHLFNGLRTIISPQLLTLPISSFLFPLYHANWISTYTFNCYSNWKLQKR